MELDPTNTSTPTSNPPATSTPARYEELKNLVASMEADFVRFFVHGNKAAGTRVRGAMQELKNLAQTIRVEVQNMKNEGKGQA